MSSTDQVSESYELKDIAPIPDFLYEPGWWEWSALATFVIILACALPLKGIWLRFRSAKLERALMLEFAAIQPLLTSDPKAAATRLVSLGKRLLAVMVPDCNFSSMSLLELQALQKETGSELVRETLAYLIELEKLKYAPKMETDLTRLYENLLSSTTQLAQLLRGKNRNRDKNRRSNTP